jgi:Tfp pilus assembly protein PilE
MNRRISINSGWSVPQSFITKSKQRLKQHIDTVYLKNGDEFEIELFNPTQNKVLAKIEMNGETIGSGIILRPGERVFLERYLDVAKKFLFETYVVNGNNSEVQSAIQNNGHVVVRFYNEFKLTSHNSLSNSNWGTVQQPTWYNHTTIGDYNPIKTFTSTSTYNSDNVGETKTFYNSSLDLNFNQKKSKTSEVRHLETGRVEKGSDSDQSFTYDNSTFNTFATWSNWWKIKPVSEQVMVKEDLVIYCTECGSKRKKDSHKFCPHCGTKF